MEENGLRPRMILYYPRVIITSSAWLKQALLYWDSIGSIVPTNLDRRIHGDRCMAELREAGVFHSFRPEQVFERNPNLGDRLFDEFRETVNSRQFQRHLKRTAARPQYFDIYPEKIPGQVTAWLEQERWAERIGEGVWRFELHTGLLYMALLAKYMADVSQFTTIPGSDYGLYKDLIFQSKGQEDPSLGLSIELQKLLPVPRKDATIDEILRFKQARRDELLHLREEMDQFQAELKRLHEFTEVRDLATRFSERMTRRVNELTEVMEDARLPFILGVAENLIKVDTIPLMGIMANPVQVPVEIQVAGAAVVGGITIRKYLLDHRNEQRRILRENSFSYLYHAKRQGLIR